MSRGDFLDANGRLLTNRFKTRRIFLFPQQFPARASYINFLMSFLNMNKTEMEKIMAEQVPVLVDKNVTRSQAEYLQKNFLPGVILADKPLRYHPAFAAHLIGYVAPVEMRGIAGLERRFDYFLKGERYEQLIALVDAREHLIRGLGFRFQRIENPGNEPCDVELTIESPWQEAVENVMNRFVASGGVLVMDPYSGDVLAMASRPTFDPNHPGEYMQAAGAPLINRAITDFYPGSIFKLVITAAALEEKITSPFEMFSDPGYYQLQNLRFRCYTYNEGGHGNLSLSKALAVSCNPVFIELGLRLGAAKIYTYAKKSGFGDQTMIGLVEESRGHLEDYIHMSPGDVANISIGQKDIKATPLQIGAFVSAIANGGILYKPRIVKQILTSRGEVRKSFPCKKIRRIISEDTAGILRTMMRAAVKNGTGQPADVPPGSSGKTGTAQTGRKDRDGNEITHAWFAGFWPHYSPKVVVVVLVEEGKTGGITAAPLFREIILRYQNSLGLARRNR